MPAELTHAADAARFHALARQWREDTLFLSSATKITEHPAYQEIIRMGPPVVPLILQDLAVHSGHWFHALHVMTGADPIQAGDAGNIQKMRDDWLAWGRAKGLI
jgi:hypothetical protein